MKPLALFIFLLCSTNLNAATYYASPSGTDGGTGAIGDPWSKMTACTSSSLNILDTILLRAGEYDTTSDFGGGSYYYSWQPQQDSVTYKAYPGEVPVIRGNRDAGSNLNSVMAPAHGTVFDSLTFRDGSKFGIRSDAFNVTVRNCNFDSIPRVSCNASDNCGVISVQGETYYMSGWLIEDNTFGPDCRGRGAIHTYGMDSTIIRRNTFNSIQASHGCIFLKSGNAGNRDNEFYENVFDIDDGEPSGIGLHADSKITNIKIHHNILYASNPVAAMIQISGRSLGDPYLDFDSIFIYNNTIDAAAHTGRVILNVRGKEADTADVDAVFIFNNLIFLPEDGEAIENINDDNTAGGSGLFPFEETWYSDYNMFVQRTSGDDVYQWATANGTVNFWTIGEWQDTASGINATFTGDPNSDTTSDTTNMFTDYSTRDYTLDSEGASYDFLSTGGRGGVWPTYIGALAPFTYTRPVHKARK